VLAGVINLRGAILPVFDLRALFGVRPEGAAEWSRVLVLGDERPEFGLLADAAFAVSTVRAGELCEPPPWSGGLGRDCLRGVTSDGLIVLDSAGLLRDPRLVIDDGEGAGS
jgi:purine-binding chemotaxis protein CheW